jgi:hypothetical protein
MLRYPILIGIKLFPEFVQLVKLNSDVKIVLKRFATPIDVASKDEVPRRLQRVDLMTWLDLRLSVSDLIVGQVGGTAQN